MRYASIATALLIGSALPAYGKGPTGFGGLKLGMTREEIEALADPEPVRPAGPLTPYQYKYTTPKAGEDKFEVPLSTPLGSSPIEAVLTFEGGRLTNLFLKLNASSSMLEQLSKQIAEKYGPGVTEDTRKEEQCIYKNGANFKLTSGVVKTKWIEDTSPNERIESILSDVSIESCPSNLRYGGIGPVKIRSLTIQRTSPTAEAKPKNLF
jgi:hypothetical protein